MKKVLSFFLAVLMILSCFTGMNMPVNAVNLLYCPTGTIGMYTGNPFSLDHNGVDIAQGKAGSYVYAAMSGTVVYDPECSAGNEYHYIDKNTNICKCNNGRNCYGFGCGVKIQGDDGYYYHYAHLAENYVSYGSRVNKGDKIGIVGNTGYSFGPHLHFCISGNEWNSYYNPLDSNMFSYTTTFNHSFDVNVVVDGKDYNSGYSGLTFDVRLNGKIVSNDVGDYYDSSMAHGTAWAVIDIKHRSDYVLTGSMDAYGNYAGGLNGDVVVKPTLTTPTLKATKYYNGNKYEFYSASTRWYSAKQFAEAKGGHLLTITSKAEQDFITNNNTVGNCWLGATKESGSWKWTNGESFVYTNWADGQPDNSKGVCGEGEKFLGIYYSGRWNDYTWYDSNVAGFIVEYDNHTHYYYSRDTVPSTCTTTGVRTCTCNCGDSYTEIIPKHSYTSDNKHIGFSKKTDAYYHGYYGPINFNCKNCSEKFTYDIQVQKAIITSIKGNIVTVEVDSTYPNLSDDHYRAYLAPVIDENRAVMYTIDLKALNINKTSATHYVITYESTHSLLDLPYYSAHIIFGNKDKGVATIIATDSFFNENCRVFRIKVGEKINGNDLLGGESINAYKEESPVDTVWSYDETKKYVIGIAPGTVPFVAINNAHGNMKGCLIIVEDNHTHSYTSSITKAATCTATGVRTYTCSCGNSYTETIAKTSHSYTSKTTISTYLKSAATCTNAAVYYYKCSTCDAKGTSTYTSDSALGHSYSKKYTVDEPATCQSEGSKSKHCTRCSAKTSVKAIPMADHSYETPCDTECMNCGEIRVAPHEYERDETIIATCSEDGLITYSCTLCDEMYDESVPSLPHTPVETIKKATLTANGKVTTTCSECGEEISSKTVYKISSVTLSSESYTYDGKVKKPTVKVTDSKGKTLKKDTDYTVKYASGRKAIGKYNVTITFKGNYSGKKTLSFSIKLKTPSISSIKPGTKKATIKWNKVMGATGYEVWYYSTSKKKYLKSGTSSKTGYTMTGLTSGKTYKVKIRAYKTVDGTKYYSKFSAVKSVKAK